LTWQTASGTVATTAPKSSSRPTPCAPSSCGRRSTASTTFTAVFCSCIPTEDYAK